jgi:hypothetical protein
VFFIVFVHFFAFFAFFSSSIGFSSVLVACGARTDVLCVAVGQCGCLCVFFARARVAAAGRVDARGAPARVPVAGHGHG